MASPPQQLMPIGKFAAFLGDVCTFCQQQQQQQAEVDSQGGAGASSAVGGGGTSGHNQTHAQMQAQLLDEAGDQLVGVPLDNLSTLQVSVRPFRF